MNERTKHLLEIVQTEKDRDIVKSLEHFDTLTNSLFALTHALFENKEIVKYFQREIEGKYFRFGIANQSLIKLIKGNHFTLIDQKVKVVDVFSIKSITRMQIESFLIMFYLFFDSVSDDEKDFRYDIYKLHGLQKQSSFKVDSSLPEIEIKLNSIISEVKILTEKIKNSKFYKEAKDKDKKDFLNPQYAKLVKSESLFRKSGIEKTGLNNMWQIYSNHAHSEYISDRQFHAASDNTSGIVNDCSLILNLNTILTAKLIVYLHNSFDSVKEKFNNIPEKEKVQIEIWSSL